MLCTLFLELYLKSPDGAGKEASELRKELISSFLEEHKVFVKYKYNDSISQRDYDEHFARGESIINAFTRKYDQLKSAGKTRSTSPKSIPTPKSAVSPSQSTSNRIMNIGYGYSVPEDHAELLRFIDGKIAELDRATRDLSAFFLAYKAKTNQFNAPVANLLNRIHDHQEVCKKLKSKLTSEWTDNKFSLLREILLPIDKLLSDIDRVKK